MELLDSLRDAAGGTGETIVECRFCGKTLEPSTDHCPICGSTEFAQYEL